jgi:hypothetical protein
MDNERPGLEEIGSLAETQLKSHGSNRGASAAMQAPLKQSNIIKIIIYLSILRKLY